MTVLCWLSMSCGDISVSTSSTAAEAESPQEPAAAAAPSEPGPEDAVAAAVVPEPAPAPAEVETPPTDPEPTPDAPAPRAKKKPRKAKPKAPKPEAKPALSQSDCAAACRKMVNLAIASELGPLAGMVPDDQVKAGINDCARECRSAEGDETTEWRCLKDSSARSLEALGKECGIDLEASGS